jgi:hypothetical protein
MKPLVITAMACATAIACVLLLRIERTPAQQRYQLYSVDEISPLDGKTIKSFYRLDAISGKTWYLKPKPFFTGTNDEQNKPIISYAYGWEETSESPDEAVEKEEAPWLRALVAGAKARRATPTPHESPKTSDISDHIDLSKLPDQPTSTPHK